MSELPSPAHISLGGQQQLQGLPSGGLLSWDMCPEDVIVTNANYVCIVFPQQTI